MTTAPTLADDPTAAPRRQRELAILTAIVLLLLAPWADKPLAIDDPLFVWTARHIAADPWDFYNFDVNWYGQPEPMCQVTQNPPLMGCYLAAAGGLLGWSENGLHAACWLPALLAAWGCYLLAERFCGRPLWAALLCVLTPAFLVSATTLMCDVAMLALWVWTVLLWVRGCDERRPGLLLLAGVLLALAALTKYFAISLVPLLAVYTGFRRWSQARGEPSLLVAVSALCIPLVAIGAYEYATRARYGVGLFSEATLYASQWSGHQRDWPRQALTALAMVGGCLPAALFLAPRLWSRGTCLGLLGTAIAVTGLIAWKPSLVWQGDTPLGPLILAAHFAVFALAGILALAVAVDDFRHLRDPASVLLVAWLLGTFAFAGFVNWTVNARSVLPLAPPLSILIVWRLERRSAARPTAASMPWPALAAAGVLSLAVAWSDFAQARSAQTAAATFWHKYGGQGTLWYQGHWGFQYYLDRLGARHTDRHGSQMSPGDTLLIPTNNTNVETLLPFDTVFPTQAQIAVPGPRWLTTMRINATSLYGGYGPLPYAVADLGPEMYGVFKLREPYRFQFPVGRNVKPPQVNPATK